MADGRIVGIRRNNFETYLDGEFLGIFVLIFFFINEHFHGLTILCKQGFFLYFQKMEPS